MLNKSKNNRPTHRTKNEESRETDVVFQKISETIVIEDYQKECYKGYEYYKNDGV